MCCCVIVKYGTGVISVAWVQMLAMVVEAKELMSNLSSSCRMINRIFQ